MSFQRQILPALVGIADAIRSSPVDALRALRDEAERCVIDTSAHDVSMADLGRSIALVNDRLVQRHITAIEHLLEAKGVQAPGLPYCWLALGSDGRMEQVMRTDQDTALVYADPRESQRSAANDYFLELAQHVTDALVLDGLSLCPGGVMACNCQWCQPFGIWERYFEDWIHRPNPAALLNEAIVFDFRAVAGDAALAESLRTSISRGLAVDKTSLILQAKNALQNPPARGLFRQLLVETRGEHRGLFDAKLRASKPLIDAIRVLALDAGVHDSTSTVERIHRLAERDSSIGPMRDALVRAHEGIMQVRFRHGTMGNGGGRYVSIKRMGATELQKLHRALQTVHELLLLVRVRYQLDALGLR